MMMPCYCSLTREKKRVSEREINYIKFKIFISRIFEILRVKEANKKNKDVVGKFKDVKKRMRC